MKDRSHKRFITALLCVTMTVCLLPVVNAMATDNSQVQTNAGITEVVDLREETVKHFDMGDGTYRAVQYGRAVHRLDSEGRWQDIDNSLSLTSTKGIQAYTSQDQRTSFAPVYTANQPLFTLSEDGTAVSLSLLTNTVNSGTVTMSASEEVLSPAVVTNSEQMQLATDAGDFDTAAAVNMTSSVLYENVLPNTDLEYVLDGNDVKENIIINAKADSYSYRFALDLDGLYPELLDSGSIILYDAVSNQEQYLIPAPFMYDANDILSEAVTYQLNHSEGKYYLTVTADADWINYDERVFPVVIDPTVQAVVDTNAFHDTFISSAYPSTNYGTYSKLWVTRDPSMYADSMIYLKPFLPELPGGSKVTDAEIALSYYYNDYCTSNFMQISAHYVTSSWTESGLTWNNASQLTNYGMSSAYIGIYYAFGAVGKYSSPGLIHIPLAVDKVNNWYNGGNDYGIGLKCHGGGNYSVIISSYEEAKSTHRPCVTVTYEPPTKLGDGVYWIKNVNNSKYVTTAAGGYAAGTVIQQNGKVSSNLRSQLYKVEYQTTIGGKYCYTVRPLTNCAMGLSGISGSGNITLQDSNQYWYIMDTGDYYSIQNRIVGSTGYLSVPNNSTNASSLIFTDGSTLRSSWTFEAYTGSKLEGLEWKKTIEKIRPGYTADFDAAIYSTTLGISESLVYTVTDVYGNATSLATINSDTGVLNAKSTGYVIVTASNNSTGQHIYFNVQIGGTHKCTITHYYDQGFVIKNSDAETQSEAEAQVVSKLKSYHEKVAAIFFEVFDLEVVGEYKSYASLDVDSPGDQCKMQQYDFADLADMTYDQLNASCSHSACHLTAREYLDTLVGDADVNINKYDHFYVVWTGHRMNNDDRPQAINELHVCVITPYLMTDTEGTIGEYYEKDDTEKYNYWSYVLMHEVSHLLGTYDQYCTEDFGEDGHCSNEHCAACQGVAADGCVMTTLDNITKVNENTPYCSYCNEIIYDTLDLYLENKELME